MVSAAALGSSAKQFSKSADTGRSVASTMALACARASSRVTMPSRLPSVPACAPLEVASAWKPRPARMRAEPASQAFADDEAAAMQLPELRSFYRMGGAYIRPPWFHSRFRPRSKPSGFRLASKLSP